MTTRTLTTFFTHRAALLAALFLAELVLVAILYQFFAQIECYKLDSETTCDFLRSLVARALVIFAVVAILVRARPKAFSGFLSDAQAHDSPVARSVHFLGLAFLLVPLVMAWGQDLGAMFRQALLPWMIGAVLGAVGGLLWLAPRKAWVTLLSQDNYSPIPILLVAAAVPDLADSIRPIWDWQVMTTATFLGVAGLLRLASPDVVADPPAFIIGIDNFNVHIAPQCSGVEGFALVTAFVSLYAFVFRSEVRLGRFALVVLPLGLLLSWVLNVVRIACLILIGARVSPELAVNGFHSYAGWLFFTILAFTLVWFVQASPWLHHRPAHLAVPQRPLRSDFVAAAILPFVVFMVVSTFIAAIFPLPGIGFPLNTLALLIAALVFLPAYRALAWGIDPVAIFTGAAIGVAWVWFAPEPDLMLESIIASMPWVVFIIWATLRLVGTIVFVPLVEEMFFRGYLLARLDKPNPWGRALALAVSTAGFAALHGRYVLAGVAGLAFALVMLRRGRVSDAIIAHVIANLIVAIAAATNRDWSLI